MARLSKAQEKARDELLAAIQVESVEQNIEIPKTGSRINFKKALTLFGLTERFSENAYVLQCAADKVTADKLKVKQNEELDTLLVAEGRAPVGPVVVGKHRQGVTSAAISVNHSTAVSRSSIKVTELINDTIEAVQKLLKDKFLEPLVYASNGSIIGLLAAGIELGIVDRYPYLCSLARHAEKCNEAYEEVANLLAENDMPPLDISSTGAVLGLLSTALFFNVIDNHAYFRQLLAASNATAIARAVMVKEGGERFAQFGTDPFLSAEARKELVAGLIATHLSSVLNRLLPQPYVQVFEASEGRTKTEAQRQFNYPHCVIETVDGKSNSEAMKEFHFLELYKSTNPFNAFSIEEEFHKQLIQHGSKYPTERMFKSAGTGGFNPKHHFDGKMYGVYLLSHDVGIPPSWKLKDKHREVISGQKRPRPEEEEQVIVG
jgi:hypothetical protein